MVNILVGIEFWLVYFPPFVCGLIEPHSHLCFGRLKAFCDYLPEFFDSGGYIFLYPQDYFVRSMVLIVSMCFVYLGDCTP